MADKGQALHSFWASFGWPAYDEFTVPTGSNAPTMPYITYQAVFGSFGEPLALYASLWDRSSSWQSVTQKYKQISEDIGYSGKIIPVDGGYMWINRGSPFAQHVGDDPDNMVRRILINISVDYLTEN